MSGRVEFVGLPRLADGRELRLPTVPRFFQALGYDNGYRLALFLRREQAETDERRGRIARRETGAGPSALGLTFIR